MDGIQGIADLLAFGRGANLQDLHERLVQLVVRRRRADDAEPSVGAEDPELPACRRPRAVLEELRYVLDLRLGLRRLGAEREERPLELADPLSGHARDAADGADPLVLEIAAWSSSTW